MPEELKSELQALGKSQYHRLRRVAAMLHYYRIDTHTIADRLRERGCSSELAEWIVRSATADSGLARQVAEDEAPEPTSQVVLKGLNGLILLVIVGLSAQFVQTLDSYAILFVVAPLLLLAAFSGFFMVMRMIVELRRRF